MSSEEMEVAPKSNNVRYTKNTSQVSITRQIEKYYELKMKYDKEKEKVINKIMSNDLSRKERKRAYSETMLKCINCNRKVGMVFEKTSNKLMARCGASSGNYKNKKGETIKECDLNISIVMPDYYDIDEIILEYDNVLSKLKKDLKILKLKHLYHHVDDDESLEIYNVLIEDYKSYTDVYSSLKAKKIENNNRKDEERQLLENEHSQLMNAIIDGFKEAEDNNDISREIKKKVFEYYARLLKLNDTIREKNEFATFFENDDDGIGSNTFQIRNLMVENEVII